MEEQPTIPPIVRTIFYFAGILAAAAQLVFPDAPILVRIGAAITFIASALGVAYRPTRTIGGE